MCSNAGSCEFISLSLSIIDSIKTIHRVETIQNPTVGADLPVSNIIPPLT